MLYLQITPVSNGYEVTIRNSIYDEHRVYEKKEDLLNYLSSALEPKPIFIKMGSGITEKDLKPDSIWEVIKAGMRRGF